MLTCVGSLTRAVLRMADQPQGATFEGKHEMQSATPRDATVGGHLLEGSLVYTTAEIAVGELEKLAFARTIDPGRPLTSWTFSGVVEHRAIVEHRAMMTATVRGGSGPL